eukprot:Rhum_TRINITY_DN14180_c34_g1::Rhum_TRINITY_DN14180_c34_g1_i1::g.72737::m.72737
MAWDRATPPPSLFAASTTPRHHSTSSRRPLPSHQRLPPASAAAAAATSAAHPRHSLVSTSSSAASSCGSSVEDGVMLASDRFALTHALERSSADDAQMVANYCAFWKRPRAMELLCHLGQDPQAEDVNGDTALHWATRGGDTQTIHSTVAGGGDPNHPNLSGVTPVALAAQIESKAAMQALTSPPKAQQQQPSTPSAASPARSCERPATHLGDSPGLRRPVLPARARRRGGSIQSSRLSMF